VLLVVIVLRDNSHRLGHQKDGVETNAKLTNQVATVKCVAAGFIFTNKQKKRNHAFIHLYLSL
jgi:hypothetical protein